MTEFFLALDQGSHASRAIAFTPTGELLDREQIAIETLNPRPGWYEHDAETLLASVVSAIDGLFSPAAVGGLPRRRSGDTTFEHRLLGPRLGCTSVTGCLLARHAQRGLACTATSGP